MPLYESMVIATRHATPAQLVKTFRKCRGILEATDKGIVRNIENLGIRPLAYRMRAHMRYNYNGRYIRFRYQASPKGAEELAKYLKIDEQIVRAVTFKQDDIAPKMPKKIVKRLRDPGFNALQGALLRKDTEVDYWAARTLLTKGLVTKEEILSLGRHYDHVPSPEPDGGKLPLPAESLKSLKK